MQVRAYRCQVRGQALLQYTAAHQVSRHVKVATHRRRLVEGHCVGGK